MLFWLTLVKRPKKLPIYKGDCSLYRLFLLYVERVHECKYFHIIQQDLLLHCAGNGYWLG